MASDRKACACCKEVKPIGRFRYNRTSPKGVVYRSSYCRMCEAEKARSWRERHPLCPSNVHSANR